MTESQRQRNLLIKTAVYSLKVHNEIVIYQAH